MNLVVCYDIADPRRLQKVARIMKDFGVRVQLSIFEVDVPPHVFRRLRARTEAVLDMEEDGVKYFHLCGPCSGKTVCVGACGGYDELGPFVVV